MFQKLLLPSDLHSLDTPAVARASELAVRCHASVALLHVIEPIQGIDSAELKEFYTTLERSTREKLAELSRHFMDRHIPVTTHAVFGKRARTIVEFATENAIDLIVLQSHRISPEGGNASWDTISYHVAVFAQCPVLLVK